MSCVDLSYHTTRTLDKGVNFDAARMSEARYGSTILGSMFKRIRQLHISLAAKCQLLFGAAVVLIITAALLVPWQRMEQLMEQISGGKSEPGHVGMAENSLLKLAAPYLENLDPQRVASVASVFRRLEILQKEGVVLTMPEFLFQ